MIESPLAVGEQMCQLLGLDPSVTRRIQLDIAVGEMPVAIVEQYLGPLTGPTTVQRFKLSPIDEGET